MGSFGGGGSKPSKQATAALNQGLTTAQGVFNQNQGNLDALTGIASDAFKANAGSAYGASPFVDNAQGAARTISNGYFLGSNPGQSTYDRLQAPSLGRGTSGLLSGGQSSDPSMRLLSGMATDNSAAPGTAALTELQSGGNNPGDRFASAVAGGQYLNNQPSASMYASMMDPSYSTNNPFLEDMIRQSGEDVTKQANRLFSSRGMGTGIGTAFTDVVSKNLADSGNALRYQNYNDAEARRLQAGGQSDAAWSGERGRMDASTGLLSNNYNAGQDRALAAAQALNSNDVANNAQRLSAAQSLGSQYTSGADRALSASNATQDRSLAAAQASDTAQQNQVAQMLQALGLTGQLSDAQYAGYGPMTDLLKTAGTLPYAGLDAYQAALANLAGAGRTQSGPGIGGQLIGAGAQLGSAAIKASDRRLKTNMVKVGEDADGLVWYDYDYLDPERFGVGRQRGVTAQDVARLRPWALGPLIDGEYQSVNYGVL